MANQMGQPNNFVPQGGAGEITVRAGSPQLGKFMTVGIAQAQPSPVVEPPQQGPAQFAPSNTPRGAQPVQMAGQGASALAVPARPAPAPAPVQRRLDGEIHVISAKGIGLDGREYIAEFDAVFPPGTKIMGVSNRLV
jgi:hypothetical protein